MTPAPLPRTDADELTDLRVRRALALRRIRGRLLQRPGLEERAVLLALLHVLGGMRVRSGRSVRVV